MRSKFEIHDSPSLLDIKIVRTDDSFSDQFIRNKHSAETAECL